MRGIRRPILAAAIAGVVLVVALLCWYFLSQRPSPTPTVQDRESTVLLIGLENAADGLRARELAVMARTDQGDVAFLIVPDELMIKLGDGDFEEIGIAVGRLGDAEIESTVGSALGVELSGTIAWDARGFVDLVNEFGGVMLNVEAAVVDRRGDAEGDTFFEIGVGGQTLGGEEALAYVRGSSEVSRSVRQVRFLRALIERILSDDRMRSARDVTRAVEPFVETGLPSSDLTDFWIGIEASAVQGLQTPILPTEWVSDDGEERLELRAVEAERIIARLIRGLELLTPNEVSVAVFNGNGIRLMASRTAEYLRARGFEVTRIANAESFDYATSYIVVLTEEAKAWVLRDALPGPVSIVFAESFEDHVDALSDLVPFGTDLLLIAGAGMEIE